MTNKTLFIPVHLDAVVVPEDRYVVGAMADFSKLPYFNGKRNVRPDTAYLSEEIVTHPFQDEFWNLKAGVHLHWALPDGLTKTMGIPIVRRQSFMNVFGSAKGGEIWGYLLNTAKWLTVVSQNDRVAQVVPTADRPKMTYNKSIAVAYPLQLKQIEELLTHPTFPAVPNRWLVIRQTGANNKASWVVESDYLFTDPPHYDPDHPIPIGSVPFPVEAELINSSNLPGVPYRYMGRRVPAGSWLEGKVDGRKSKNYLADPLTAVGYGEPNFAAFYPNCHSLFGFYDDKIELKPADLKNTEYTVYGWYDHTSQDYYNYFIKNFTKNLNDDRPKNIQLLEAIKHEFGWQVPIKVTKSQFGSMTDPLWTHLHELKWLDRDPDQLTNNSAAVILPFGQSHGEQLIGKFQPKLTKIQDVLDTAIKNQLPQRMICHSRLKFSGVSTKSLTPVAKTTEVQVAVGNSGTEALASYLTATVSDSAERQAMVEHLEAVQLASQLDNKVLDVGPRFKEGMHSRGFQGIDAGVLWTVRKMTPDGQPADAAHAHGKSQITLPLHMAHLLNEANRLQLEFDRAQDEITSLRHQIYADWCKYLLAVYPPAGDLLGYENGDQIKHFMLQNDLPKLEKLIAETGELYLNRDPKNHIKSAKTDKPGTKAAQLAQAINAVISGFSEQNLKSKQTINSTNSNHPQWLNSVGGATISEGADLSLHSDTGEAGAVWFKQKQRVDRPFKATFSFTSLHGAEGVAFVIQNSSSTALGTGGGGMGYSGIPNSLAIELDTKKNADPTLADLPANHLAVMTRGVLPNSSSHQYALGSKTIGTTHPDKITISYKPGALEISVGRKKILSVSADLANALDLDDGQAWVGFTAGSNKHPQLIANWTFTTVRPPTASEFVLDRVSAPRYWQPTEPVVLLTGPDAKYTERHGQDGKHQESGLLVCQTASIQFSNPPTKAELQTLSVPPKQSGIGYKTWKKQTWHPFMLEWSAGIFPRLGQHHQTFDGNYDSGFLAGNYELPLDQADFRPTPQSKGIIGSRKPYTGFSILTPHVGEKLRHDIERELIDLAHDAVLQAFFKANRATITKKTTPTDQEILNTSALLKAFNRWATTHLKLKAQPLSNSGNLSPFRKVQGWIKLNISKIVKWLTTDAAFQILPATLKNKRRALLKELDAINPDPAKITKASQALHAANVRFSLLTLAKAYSPLEKGDYLAQSLGGFNNALLGRKQTLQLPLADPLGFHDQWQDHNAVDDQALAKRVQSAVLNGNISAPQPHNPFMPIRTGAMSLTHMRLVDTFGRTKTVSRASLQNPHLPETLKSKETADAPIALRPRFAHPARLNFRWLSAHDRDIESNDQPATSPICGWLVPNKLDNSVMVYDPSGMPLGSLVASDSRTPWHPAPGYDLPLRVDDIGNTVLRQTVQNLVECQINSQKLYNKMSPSSFLDHFLSSLNSALEHIDPENFARHQARALLMGRPVALVQAKVGFELQGLPAVDNSWEALTRDLDKWNNWAADETRPKPAPPQRRDRLYDRIKIPVRIGEYEQLNDGLVGYWTEKPAQNRLNAIFYALQSGVIDDPFIKTRDPNANHHDLANHRDSDFHLNLSVADGEQVVTMLLDPRGSVHATCGILPTKEITIPSDQYMHALDSIEVTFLTTPLLTSQDEIALSLPSEPGFSWSWLGKDGQTWREVGTVGTLSQAQLEGRFNGSGVNAIDVWHALLKAGWIKFDEAQKGTVMPSDQRTEPKLDKKFNAVLPLIEQILAQTHINPFQISAADVGPQEIREGWLKLEPQK